MATTPTMTDGYTAVAPSVPADDIATTQQAVQGRPARLPPRMRPGKGLIPRRILRLGVVAAVGASVLFWGALPAFAAPPLPPNCTFNGATGQTTCTTTSTSSATDTVSTNDVTVPASTVFDGFTGVRICDVANSDVVSWTQIAMLNVVLTITSTTTTITVHQGVSPNGHVVSTSSTTSSALSDVELGGYPSDLSCSS